jgi:TolB protein
MKVRSLIIPIIATSLCLVGILAAGTPALATYPGTTNGRLAFAMTANGNVDLYSALPNGQGMQQLTTDPAFDACPAYSPDGKQIAFCSNRSGNFEIWAMKENGTDQHQVTTIGGRVTFPDYSPDGTTLAFSGTRPGDTVDHIFTSNLQGGGLTALTTEADGNNDYPAWSPDGTKIAFISDRTGVEQVWVMKSDGTHLRQLTTNPVTHDQLPDWSPDGSRIAYQQGDSPNGRIFVMNADGSNQRQLTFGPGDDFGAAWSPDGSQIAFVRDFGNGDRPVYVMNADGSRQHPLTGRGVTQFVPGWQPRGVPQSFRVSFTSHGAGMGLVFFGSGPGCLGLVQVATQDTGAGTTHHTIVVTGNDLPGTVGNIGIQAGTTYWYETVTVSAQGTEVDNNGGKCFSVTIPSSEEE